MPDEAADRPADQGADSSQDAAAPTAPIATPHAAPAGSTAAGSPAGGPAAGSTIPQPPGSVPPPPPPPPYGGAPAGDEAPAAGPTPPPWFGTGPTDGSAFFSRQNLIRPTDGRHVAGVCAAIGRATNTDPVLWRVVLAVLGFFGGIGLLIYLVGWLIIPSEGDTASPIEALLGRGRSQMSPLAVLIVGGAAALIFAFIVDNGFRATLLGGAIVVGGVLLYRRNTATDTGAPAPPTFPPGPAAPQAHPAEAYAAAGPAPAAAAPAGEPVTAPLPPLTPPAAPSFGPPPPPPPPSGYRPPFAPHGPYAGPQPPWRTAPPPPAKPPKAAKPPKPPRERSKLGRITFFAVLVTLGVVAVLDLGGLSVLPSAYFAAALVTIALGLMVGTWFGRARGLIALALLTTVGLGMSSASERWGVAGVGDPVTWQPATVAGIADRYETPVGDVTLDLRQVDFAGQVQQTAIEMHAGKLRVLLPPSVDTTAVVAVDIGSTDVLGRLADGPDLGTQEVTDLGADGAGGGQLRLDISMDAGEVEITR